MCIRDRFQYGRYLLISSSRPGTQPANLQGIWNQHLRAPWSSNYTVNINTEMNYWGAETVNLPEMHEPLFDLIRNLRISGGNTARIHYNAGGFVSHHNSDIWCLSTPVGNRGKGTAVYALSLIHIYIHKSGFSFSVGADKADMLSLEQTEGYIMKNSPVPKTMGKVFNI